MQNVIFILNKFKIIYNLWSEKKAGGVNARLAPLTFMIYNCLMKKLILFLIVLSSFAFADNPFEDGYYQKTNPLGKGYVQDNNPFEEGYYQKTNPLGKGYVQDANPFEDGYIQDNNPFGKGYVQDKAVFGFEED
jgi:hypothetical protein